MSDPLQVQVGGDHYKRLGEYQPWEVLARWLTPDELRGYAKGTAIAYLARERDKGGLEDIDKALHTLELYRALRGECERRHASVDEGLSGDIGARLPKDLEPPGAALGKCRDCAANVGSGAIPCQFPEVRHGIARGCEYFVPFRGEHRADRDLAAERDFRRAVDMQADGESVG